MTAGVEASYGVADQEGDLAVGGEERKEENASDERGFDDELTERVVSQVSRDKEKRHGQGRRRSE